LDVGLTTDFDSDRPECHALYTFYIFW